MSDEAIRKLRELGELRESGVLTQAEFEQGKARLLSGEDAALDGDGGGAVALEEKPAAVNPIGNVSLDDLASAPAPGSVRPPLSAGVIVALAILTAGIGVPIYLLIKQRHRAAAIVGIFVSILWIAAAVSGASDNGESGRDASSSIVGREASDSAEDEEEAAEAAREAEREAAEAAAAEAEAAKQAAAEAAAAKKRREAAAARRRARINNASFPDERTLKLILKNPDAHQGKVFRIWGEIIQFDSRTGTDSFLADVANRNTTSYGFFTGDTALFTGSERQLARYIEDDLFTAVVEVTGSFSYDTAIGGSNTVPAFKIIGGLERQGSTAS